MRCLLALLACVATFSVRAADAPVPVTQEPMHRTVFENDVLRVIDVQIPPAAITKYHVHLLPSVVLYLTKSTNKSQTWGETKFLERTLTPGESRYAPYDVQPLTHQVTNTGNTLFRVYDIELLHPKPASSAPESIPAVLTPQWTEKFARASKVQLEPGASCDIIAGTSAHLLVGVTGALTASADAKSPAQDLKWADYRFFAAHTPLRISNSGKEKAEGVLLELY